MFLCIILNYCLLVNLKSVLNIKVSKKSKFVKQILRTVYNGGERIFVQGKNFIDSSENQQFYNHRNNIQDVIENRYVGLRNKIRKLKFEVFGNPDINMAYYRKHKQEYIDDDYLIRIFKINKILDLEEYINFNQHIYLNQNTNNINNLTLFQNKTLTHSQINNLTLPLTNNYLLVNTSGIRENSTSIIVANYNNNSTVK